MTNHNYYYNKMLQSLLFYYHESLNTTSQRQGIKKLTNIRYKDMGDKKNMFSVVVPAYNCERTIVRAIFYVIRNHAVRAVRRSVVYNNYFFHQIIS